MRHARCIGNAAAARIRVCAEVHRSPRAAAVDTMAVQVGKVVLRVRATARRMTAPPERVS